MDNDFYQKHDIKIATAIGILISIAVVFFLMKKTPIDNYSRKYNEVRFMKKIPIIEDDFKQRGNIWENNSREYGHYAKNIVLDGQKILEEQDYYKFSDSVLIKLTYHYERGCFDAEVVRGVKKDNEYVCSFITRQDTLFECKFCSINDW